MGSDLGSVLGAGLGSGLIAGLGSGLVSGLSFVEGAGRVLGPGPWAGLWLGFCVLDWARALVCGLNSLVGSGPGLGPRPVLDPGLVSGLGLVMGLGSGYPFHVGHR